MNDPAYQRKRTRPRAARPAATGKKGMEEERDGNGGWASVRGKWNTARVSKRERENEEEERERDREG